MEAFLLVSGGFKRRKNGWLLSQNHWERLFDFFTVEEVPLVAVRGQQIDFLARCLNAH
jgi:hypothetical protein